MFTKIPYKLAVHTVLLLLSLILVFHLFVLLQIIPYSIVWGGRLQNVAQMRQFEAVSLSINALIMMVVAIKGEYIKVGVSGKIINGIVWLLAALFALNTLGNLFAKANLETILFTPLTAILAILCIRIALEKGPVK